VNDNSLDEFLKYPLPTQKEITVSWNGMLPVVSIICTTYNHEQYIEDAIRGFLIQKTTFPFEIIIHDDASTDETRNIVDKYAKQYPGLIKAIIQEENQYSKGTRVMLLAASYGTGQFLALCEGDDFWISPEKLQTQVESLDKFSDCEICFHSAIKTTQGKPDKQLFCKRANDMALFDVPPIIRCGGSFMPTASMLIKKTFFDRVLQENYSFYKKHLTGYYYQIFCSLSGGALYIDRPMSVYRSFSSGSWTEKMTDNQEFYKRWLSNYISSLREANAITEYKYSEDFLASIKRCHLSVLNNLSLDLKFRQDYLLNNREEIGIYGIALWKAIFQYPVMHKVVKKIRWFCYVYIPAKIKL
tara:strand:+ start:1323 stop:2393 length:1071 start_codon:yes stop_codon:yes gene_type:complete